MSSEPRSPSPSASRRRSPSPPASRRQSPSAPRTDALRTSLTSLLQHKALALANAFGLSVTRVGAEGVCTAVLRSRTSHFVREILLQVDSQLGCRTPMKQVERDVPEQFKNVVLADDHWFRPATVSLVLGADLCPHIIQPGILPSTNGLPMAQNTAFGWVLSGTCGQ
ncbi:hypothetical protein ACLKA6_018668 [Drosophila palustris]